MRKLLTVSTVYSTYRFLCQWTIISCGFCQLFQVDLDCSMVHTALETSWILGYSSNSSEVFGFCVSRIVCMNHVQPVNSILEGFWRFLWQYLIDSKIICTYLLLKAEASFSRSCICYLTYLLSCYLWRLGWFRGWKRGKSLNLKATKWATNLRKKSRRVSRIYPFHHFMNFFRPDIANLVLWSSV